MPRVILCVDMDAFFASVEQQANPRLRGKPVAVIGSGHRTVVTTRSYEARKYGVKTGMNIYEAKRLCPNIIFVAVDNEKYTYTCAELRKIYGRYTPDVEVYSIDEAFLDITTTRHLFGGAEAVGAAIKKEVKKRFGINCTAGIGPNILIAKLASDLSKPDGLRRVREDEIQTVICKLPVKELWGIGPAIAGKLALIGVRTCGELGNAPVGLLRSKFGIMGETLKLMGQGLCSRPLIVREQPPKSIGHSMTLPHDISGRGEIEAQLLKLCEMVGKRARKCGLAGEKVSLTIRYPDFETFTKQATLPEHTNITHEIYRCALEVLNGIRLRDKVRLIGVGISHLKEDDDNQMFLFDYKTKGKSILQAVDAVNDKYGEFTVTWASCFEGAGVSNVISPSWRPSGVRNTKVI